MLIGGWVNGGLMNRPPQKDEQRNKPQPLLHRGCPMFERKIPSSIFGVGTKMKR